MKKSDLSYQNVGQKIQKKDPHLLKLLRECDKPTTVEFESDSKLELIDKETFSNTAIHFISIPATVKFIKEGCFLAVFIFLRLNF